MDKSIEKMVGPYLGKFKEEIKREVSAGNFGQGISSLPRSVLSQEI